MWTQSFVRPWTVPEPARAHSRSEADRKKAGTAGAFVSTSVGTPAATPAEVYVTMHGPAAGRRALSALFDLDVRFLDDRSPELGVGDSHGREFPRRRTLRHHAEQLE